MIAGIFVLGSALFGGFFGFWVLQGMSENKTGHLDPVAERDVRAKFMPRSAPAVDDSSIQPEKRSLKPEDP
jgi:hypothetical protein